MPWATIELPTYRPRAEHCTTESPGVGSLGVHPALGFPLPLRMSERRARRTIRCLIYALLSQSEHLLAVLMMNFVDDIFGSWFSGTVWLLRYIIFVKIIVLDTKIMYLSSQTIPGNYEPNISSTEFIIRTAKRCSLCNSRAHMGHQITHLARRSRIRRGRRTPSARWTLNGPTPVLSTATNDIADIHQTQSRMCPMCFRHTVAWKHELLERTVTPLELMSLAVQRGIGGHTETRRWHSRPEQNTS